MARAPAAVSGDDLWVFRAENARREKMPGTQKYVSKNGL
jgi:hypothetical protein